ncbi:MAG TPA: hypothetical protein VFU43_09330 [Streptosporangiaceae bacterium]|nr:hypothetical protein [Streptosporangiaceae bacterium]
MALFLDELANQVLELTRVVSTGPVLEPGEPLRVDIIPAGDGSQVTGLLGGLAPYDYNILRLHVTYKVFREGEMGDELLAEGDAADPKDYLRVPATPDPAPAADLLSVAFLFKPRIKFGQKPPPPQLDLPPVELPRLDHRLEVTVAVGTTVELVDIPGTYKFDEIVAKTIVLKFAVPTVTIPLPVVPALCVCSRHANLALEQEGVPGKFLVMIAPGGPSTLSEVIAIYNQIIEAVSALAGVLDLASVMLSPLQKVADLLESIPSPFVSTERWVEDFDVFDSFDDEMSSFLLIAPTDIRVQFSDEANPNDWDASGDIGLKEYQPIDLLQLVGTAGEEAADDVSKSELQLSREYVRGLLGMSTEAITNLKSTIATLLGSADVDAVTLGLGVMFVANLSIEPSENSEGVKAKHLLMYDNKPDDELQNDVESARWLPPHLGL